MKIIYIFFLLITCMYPMSYAKFTWKRKEYLPCIGIVYLTLMAFITASVMVLIR